MRMVVPADRRGQCRLEERKEAGGYYRFRWQYVAPGYREPGYIRVDVHSLTGNVFTCNFADRCAGPGRERVRDRKEMEEKVERAIGSVKPEYLKLFESYRLGRRMLCWQYEVPARPEGRPLVTDWDAVTGELVSSNMIDGDGNRIHEDEFHGNPEHCPPSKEETIKRLEEVALERARELEARKGGE